MNARRFSFVADTGLVATVPLSLCARPERQPWSPASRKLDATGRWWTRKPSSAGDRDFEPLQVATMATGRYR